jgi:hypothetical protein
MKAPQAKLFSFERTALIFVLNKSLTMCKNLRIIRFDTISLSGAQAPNNHQ